MIVLVPTWLTENHTYKMPLGKWMYKRNGKFWSCSKILTTGASQWPILSQQLSVKGMHFALPLLLGSRMVICGTERDNASHPHTLTLKRGGGLCSVLEEFVFLLMIFTEVGWKVGTQSRTAAENRGDTFLALYWRKVKVKVAQLHPTLCGPVD